MVEFCLLACLFACLKTASLCNYIKWLTIFCQCLSVHGGCFRSNSKCRRKHSADERLNTKLLTLKLELRLFLCLLSPCWVVLVLHHFTALASISPDSTPCKWEWNHTFGYFKNVNCTEIMQIRVNCFLPCFFWVVFLFDCCCFQNYVALKVLSESWNTQNNQHTSITKSAAGQSPSLHHQARCKLARGVLRRSSSYLHFLNILQSPKPSWKRMLWHHSGITKAVEPLCFFNMEPLVAHVCVLPSRFAFLRCTAMCHPAAEGGWLMCKTKFSCF